MATAADYETLDWGRTRYREAFDRQLERVRQRIAGEVPDALIYNEHEPVYTIGARKGAEAHLIWQAEQLEKQGIEVVRTNRGGDITYHGPGQIVGYPIIDLRRTRDLHAYLRDLEEVLICTVGDFGIAAGRRDGMTGIWAGSRKLAAIGVAVKQWVTYHGFALNLDPDLAHFGGIVPCGITNGAVSSMAAELDSTPSRAEVTARLTEHFWEHFAQ